jgi:arabinan endo-1,5-alpha-L-arabinosidase
MVGRREKIYGPYSDKDGVPMNFGGGLLVPEEIRTGTVQATMLLLHLMGNDYLVFHVYDAHDNNGRSKLRIEKLNWINGWPVVFKNYNN